MANPWLAAALARLDASIGQYEANTYGNALIRSHHATRPPCSPCAGTGDVFNPDDMYATRDAGTCKECGGTGYVESDNRKTAAKPKARKKRLTSHARWSTVRAGDVVVLAGRIRWDVIFVARFGDYVDATVRRSGPEHDEVKKLTPPASSPVVIDKGYEES
jgi:hypothetical protein